MSTADLTPAGYCQCGCGQQTPLATMTRTRYGLKKGEPLRFIHGHNARKAVHYIAEDRGYETPCWIWQLALSKDGHGRYLEDGRMQQAHRVHYQRRFGPLSPDVELHHRCTVRPCVNPDHLEPLTTVEHRHEHARLTWEIVGEIRAEREGGASLAYLERRFGVSQGHLSEICNHKAWKESS